MVAQVTAVIIFLVMFALIITDKIERQYVTLGCGLAGAGIWCIHAGYECCNGDIKYPIHLHTGFLV